MPESNQSAEPVARPVSRGDSSRPYWFIIGSYYELGIGTKAANPPLWEPLNLFEWKPALEPIVPCALMF
jgi:hypothetical protein